MTNHLEQYKQSAMGFFSMAFNDCKPGEAVQNYVGMEYIQHNPMVGNGSRSIWPLMKNMGNAQ